MINFREVLKPIARENVAYGGRKTWYGCLVRHKGHPHLASCGHKHSNALEAKECAATMLHCDAGSLLADNLTIAVNR